MPKYENWEGSGAQNTFLNEQHKKAMELAAMQQQRQQQQYQKPQIALPEGATSNPQFLQAYTNFMNTDRKGPANTEDLEKRAVLAGLTAMANTSSQRDELAYGQKQSMIPDNQEIRRMSYLQGDTAEKKALQDIINDKVMAESKIAGNTTAQANVAATTAKTEQDTSFGREALDWVRGAGNPQERSRRISALMGVRSLDEGNGIASPSTIPAMQQLTTAQVYRAPIPTEVQSQDQLQRSQMFSTHQPGVTERRPLVTYDKISNDVSSAWGRSKNTLGNTLSPTGESINIGDTPRPVQSQSVVSIVPNLDYITPSISATESAATPSRLTTDRFTPWQDNSGPTPVAPVVKSTVDSLQYKDGSLMFTDQDLNNDEIRNFLKKRKRMDYTPSLATPVQEYPAVVDPYKKRKIGDSTFSYYR